MELLAAMAGHVLGLAELKACAAAGQPAPWQYSTLLQNETAFSTQRMRLADVLRRG